jgi:hypothetical protein
LPGNGYVFYAVRVISKESRGLLLPRTSCLNTLSVGLSRQYRVDYGMTNECGEVGGMQIGRGNRITQKKPVPMPFYPP